MSWWVIVLIVLGIPAVIASWRDRFRAMCAMLANECSSTEWDDVLQRYVRRPGKLDGFDIVAAAFVATFIFWVAPILLAGRLICAAFRDPSAEQVARILGGESRAQKRSRRERELRAREQHIRELERELGISNEGDER